MDAKTENSLVEQGRCGEWERRGHRPCQPCQGGQAELSRDGELAELSRDGELAELTASSTPSASKAFAASSTPSAPSALVAMSGGVDSSVAAALLHEGGYRVVGATCKLFGNDDVLPEGVESTCCSLDDVEDARQACRRLGAPHYTLNFTDSFKSQVIDRFCTSYLCGQTPNPCIDCNRYLKFEALQRRRRELGLDYVATGHYARRTFDEKTGRYLLLRGVDAAKDQSYVLFHVTQDTLAHLLLPLGELRKPEVREIARAHGFASADKDESQDICFVPDKDYASFIARYLQRDENSARIAALADEEAREYAGISGSLTVSEDTAARRDTAARDDELTRGNAPASRNAVAAADEDASELSAEGGRASRDACSSKASFAALEPGPIVDLSGHVIGMHQGIARYTVGQRKGIGIAAREPLYVCRKDADSNTLVVGTASDARICRVVAHDVNLISVDALKKDWRVTAKTHYRQAAQPALARQLGDSAIEVVFETPQPPCAPGQALVLYDGDVVIGGGTITSAR